MISKTWLWFPEEKILVWGQITNLGSFRVKFQKSTKVGKLYIKMTLLTSAFQKKGSRGQQRSPEVKNFEKRSNLKSHWKWVNGISKWRSWRQLFKKRGHEVNKGHPRSKISKIGQISKVIESRLMVYKNDALAVSFLIEGVMRWLKVTWGQKSRKRSNFELC